MGKTNTQHNRTWRWIWWNINRHLVPLVLNRNFGSMRLAKDADKLPPAPFIMISNHGNFSDPWIVGHYSPTPVSIMMNEEGFKSNIFTRWYLTQIGAFPKKKGLSDIKAMKTSLQRLKQGYPLLVFPEGQTTWDGETQPIYGGIEKIAKKGKVPIVLNRLQGNFICHPWWSTKRRKGEIIVNRKVLSSEQVQAMSVDDIQEEMLSYLQHNDIKHYQSDTTLFTGSDICDGLQQLLWICPQCKKETGLSVTPESVSCPECKMSFEFYPNMVLKKSVGETADLHDWVAMQKEWAQETYCSMQTEEDSAKIFNSEHGIRLIRVDYGGRKITLDTGILELTKEQLYFRGEDGDLAFEIGKISAPVFQNQNILQFDYQGSSYQFLLENLPLFKWLFILRYATGYSEAEESRVFI